MIAPGAGMLTDPEFLERLIGALVERAVRGMPKGGRITLGARLEQITDASAAGDFPVGIGQRVTIEVRDTGAAIQGDALARVFEPVETSDPEGSALAALYLRTIDCGGEIRVRSARGAVIGL